MRVAVTGTPGTGKTTATELLETGRDLDLDLDLDRDRDRNLDRDQAPDVEVDPDLDVDVDVVHLNEVVRERGFTLGRDEERDTVVADLDAVEAWLDGRDAPVDGDVVVESHLSHRLAVDRVVVLRCDPASVEQRLLARGEPEATARENAESEALAGILTEAVAEHGQENVYEVVTTDRPPVAVAVEIAAIVRGEREPSAGTVTYVEYLE